MSKLTAKDIYRAHGLYQCGMSLAQAAERIGTTRNGLWDRFKRMNLPTRPKKQRPSKVYDGVTYYKDRDGAYRSRITDKSIYLHVLVFGELVPPGYALRFKDGDKDNIVKENLELYHKTEFFKHSKGNQNAKPNTKL